MRQTPRGTAIRKLLELCDDLQRVRCRLTQPNLARDARTRLRRQVRTKTDRLARDLTKYRFHGPLAVLLREFSLEPIHFQILATLLHRRLRSDEPALEGRAILASVFDNPFDVLTGIELLQDTGVLRASGLILLDDEEDSTEDVLEAGFRISDDALTAFREEVAGLVVEDRRHRAPRYASHHEYLVDLRILHNLYKHRSERIFQQDRWDRVHAGSAAPARLQTRRIQAYWERIERRLRNTPDASEFPAVRFAKEYQLSGPELIIVVHLLFKELYEGNGYADAAELVRLVSAEELELVRNRRLMHAQGSLIRHEIIKIEAMIEGREMTGEVVLSDWAVNYLFGADAGDSAIGSDDRLDWHLYLKELEDTQRFYKDLEKN
jgi:hypothetical protein